jgi:hypothetical protein
LRPFFLRPQSPAHRRYEALPAYRAEGLPADQALPPPVPGRRVLDENVCSTPGNGLPAQLPAWPLQVISAGRNATKLYNALALTVR